ncbi:hypothetical protein ACHCAL_00295 [Providencia huaxiensis]|uniref:hypothetical protein n=1 Tax=Providencia huaxiensis TaxID=2027290 RepID=UPI00242C13F0|nr:hypothetical protein [Providencia huaxiensis]
MIGVQLLDGTRVISINQTPLAKPDASSIIWDNIKSTNEKKWSMLNCVAPKQIVNPMKVIFQQL